MLIAAGATVGALAGGTSAAPQDIWIDVSLASTALQDEGPAYTVSSLTLQYAQPLQFLPELDELARSLQQLTVQMGTIDGVWVAPRPGVETITIEVQRDIIEGGPVTMRRSAVDAIADAFELQQAGTPGRLFYVAPDPEHIDPATGEDRRRRNETTLGLVVSFEGPMIPVSAFELNYAIGHSELPPVETILGEATVGLVDTPQGYVVWREDADAVEMTLAEAAGSQTRQFSAGAIQAVLEAIRDYFTQERNLMAVYARPAQGELDPNGLTDTRGGRTSFRIDIIVGSVSEVRTLAVGDRIPVEERIDNPAHERIRLRSPFQPGAAGEGAEPDLLQRTKLDRYLYYLTRHPGRRVDAGIAPADEPLSVGLDYIVTENKPWVIYGQLSNTGTDETDTWRSRFGFFHNQLTGRDDILSIEYVTPDYEDNHAVIGMYDARLFDLDRVRWRVLGDWQEYDASEIGFSDARFTSDTWGIGGELAWNVYQKDQLFLDVVGGVRYEDIEVENAFVFVEGDQDFFNPYIGARLQRYTSEANTDVSLFFEFNAGGITDVNEEELNALGRLFADKDWVLMRWDASQSFYLEPLLNRAAWEDVSTPDSSTLAHEIALRFRGQHSFGYRLIPQQEMTAGGLWSVRGYPESVSVGDTVFIGTAEYRLHLPRAFGVKEDPATFMGRPFRAVPQFPYGQADWDLIFRGFVDVASTTNTDRFSFERDDTLVGVGGGIQVLYKRNIDVRMDWGVALEEIEGEVNSGSNRFHLVVTILY
jgi:hypothetical protein